MKTDDIVRAIRDGDREAWTRLWDRFELRILGFLGARMGPEVRALWEPEDLAQEVFLTAARRLSTFEDGLPFYPWLAGIAANVLRDAVRKARAEKNDPRREVRLGATGAPVRDPTSRATTPTQAARRNETYRRLHAALAELPPSWREAYELVFFEGLDRARAAARLGITRENLQVRLGRAIRRLSAALSETEG